MALSMEKWRGKIAVVTGASAGIGGAIVDQLVQHGITVVGLARRVELIEAKSKTLQETSGKLHGLKCDLTKPEEIIEVFKNIEETFGPISILVNNAGVLRDTRLIDGNIEDWKLTVDTNIIGLSVATREALASMKKNNIDGHIIHMNSILGHEIAYAAMPVFNIYTATKYAVTALAGTLISELKAVGSRIKVTSISPGLVKTDIFQAGNFQGDVYKLPYIEAKDVADGIIYALSTPPHVQVTELTLRPVGGY